MHAMRDAVLLQVGLRSVVSKAMRSSIIIVSRLVYAGRQLSLDIIVPQRGEEVEKTVFIYSVCVDVYTFRVSANARFCGYSS